MSTFHTIGARLSALFFILLFCSTTFAGSTKVEVCHVPPDSPENFHTITINANALPSHLAHGDLGEACNAFCASLCDDGNACTIDDSGDCEQNGCPVTPEQVDCDDQNECTTDSCDPATACVNTPRLGEACDDGQLCSGPDMCNAAGVCAGEALDNCCIGNEDCSQNLCDQAECNTETNRCGDDPVVCNPTNLCDMSVCAPDTGECVDSPIVCDEGEVCDPSSGECESAIECPCFDESILQGLGTIEPNQCGNDFPFAGIAAVFYTNGNLACSGTNCNPDPDVNPGCGYSDGINFPREGPITDEEDAACRALIVNSCASSTDSDAVSAEGSAVQYSTPLLSN